MDLLEGDMDQEILKSSFLMDLEIFSKLNENARFLADGVHEKIMDTIHPGIMDDRYAFIYHVSYLQARLATHGEPGWRLYR